MHQKNKYGKCRTGYGVLWTVFSDHAHSAGSNGKRDLINGGKASDSSFCNWQYQSPDGQTISEELVLSSGAGNPVRGNLQAGARTFWKRWYQKDQEKMQRLRAITIGGKTATSQTLPRSA